MSRPPLQESDPGCWKCHSCGIVKFGGYHSIGDGEHVLEFHCMPSKWFQPVGLDYVCCDSATCMKKLAAEIQGTPLTFVPRR